MRSFKTALIIFASIAFVLASFLFEGKPSREEGGHPVKGSTGNVVSMYSNAYKSSSPIVAAGKHELETSCYLGIEYYESSRLPKLSDGQLVTCERNDPLDTRLTTRCYDGNVVMSSPNGTRGRLNRFYLYDRETQKPFKCNAIDDDPSKNNQP